MIDAKTGTVTLPNGFTFSPSLRQAEFEATPFCCPSRNPGTPWYYFSFDASEINGHPFGANLCFYEQVLVSAHFSISLYPKTTPPQDYSLEIEARQHTVHLRMLRQWLGKPHHQRQSKFFSEPSLVPLNTSVTYVFPWGVVGCNFDERAGMISFGLRYSKQDEWARNDYAKKMRRPQLRWPKLRLPQKQTP